MADEKVKSWLLVEGHGDELVRVANYERVPEAKARVVDIAGQRYEHVRDAGDGQWVYRAM